MARFLMLFTSSFLDIDKESDSKAVYISLDSLSEETSEFFWYEQN